MMMRYRNQTVIWKVFFLVLGFSTLINISVDYIIRLYLDDQYFMVRATRVTPLDFEFTINGPSDCSSGNTDDLPRLVVLVMTMHDHVAERNAIRETWGSVVKTNRWGKERLPLKVTLVFMLGSPDDRTKSELAKKENELFHDIVEASFKEAYHNLTYKVLMGFKWVKQFCSSASYILKADEDTFMNMKRLSTVVLKLDKHTVFGPFFKMDWVSTSGKHSCEDEPYPFLFYPPHVKGNFYVMSTNLAFNVLEVAEYMPYVCMEDAHITGILIKVVEGKHVGPYTAAYDPYGDSPQECDFMRPYKLAAQKVFPAKARQIWNTIIEEHSCSSK